MSEYLITCVRKGDSATGHKHIVKVGIGNEQYTTTGQISDYGPKIGKVAHAVRCGYETRATR